MTFVAFPRWNLQNFWGFVIYKDNGHVNASDFAFYLQTCSVNRLFGVMDYGDKYTVPRCISDPETITYQLPRGLSLGSKQQQGYKDTERKRFIIQSLDPRTHLLSDRG